MSTLVILFVCVAFLAIFEYERIRHNRRVNEILAQHRIQNNAIFMQMMGGEMTDEFKLMDRPGVCLDKPPHRAASIVGIYEGTKKS